MVNMGNWQDYRGKGEGVLIHLSTTRLHALPVRELAEAGGDSATEPNFETGTFGFLQCLEARTRAAALKARRRYFLFGTRYQGLEEGLRGRFLIIGYMRLDKVMEVRKRHVHKWMERNTGAPPECMDMESCYAFQSEEMNFYSPDDAYELTETLMKQWGYKGKITKQMKLTFAEDKLESILAHFRAKAPRNAEYKAALREVEEKSAQASEAAAAADEDW